MHTDGYRSRCVVIRVCATVLLIVIASCSPPASEPAFYDQVRTWVPRGTPVEQAQAIMETQRFEVYEARDGDGRRYLDCTRTRFDAARGYEIEWRAKLFLTGDESATMIGDIAAEVDEGRY